MPIPLAIWSTARLTCVRKISTWPAAGSACRQPPKEPPQLTAPLPPISGWEKFSKPAEPLPMPMQQLVRIIGALTDGLLIAHWQSPEDFDEALIVSAFEALAGPTKSKSSVENLTAGMN